MRLADDELVQRSHHLARRRHARDAPLVLADDRAGRGAPKGRDGLQGLRVAVARRVAAVVRCRARHARHGLARRRQRLHKDFVWRAALWGRRARAGILMPHLHIGASLVGAHDGLPELPASRLQRCRDDALTWAAVAAALSLAARIHAPLRPRCSACISAAGPAEEVLDLRANPCLRTWCAALLLGLRETRRCVCCACCCSSSS